MSQVQQSIRVPLGVNVFGSALMRVEPDTARLSFSVSRRGRVPADAFTLAQEGAQSVAAFLSSQRLQEVGSSRASLYEDFEHVDGVRRFAGYVATIQFTVVVHDLTLIQPILVGVVDAGANNVSHTELSTSKLKAYRAEARRRAVLAAREKAMIYCDACGVELGTVVHIEDVDPRILSQQYGHHRSERAPDDEPVQAFNPESIVVEAAVMISYTLAG
jgi:uncharacterized protein